MSYLDFEILAAMDREDEAEARARQDDAPPAKRQKGSALSVVDTDDGGLDLVLINDDGIVKTTHIFPTTVEILKCENLKAFERRNTWKLSSFGYVAWGFHAIHRIMGDTLSDDEARERWGVRFSENPHERLEVGHLDDNRLNFNIKNLEKIPESVNLLSKKTKPQKTPLNKFRGILGYNNKKVATKTVDTEAEAFFAIDVTKLRIVPADIQEYLLKHAMWRPKEYEDRYSSVEKMLSYAKMYEPRERKKPAKRESKNTYFAYRDLAEAMEALPEAHAATIKRLFAMPGVVPFDALIDAIVYYIGARCLQLVFVVNYDFYAKHMMVSKPRMTTTHTHLQMDVDGKLTYLHNKIMGREVGQSQKDGLHGGHGAGKVLDNRARVLKPLTPAENLSDKGNVLLQSAPGVVGVSWDKAHGKWYAQIKSFLKRGDKIFLGHNDDQAVAASLYVFANANKEEFKTRCGTMPDTKTRNNYVRACCVAQAMLPLAAGAQKENVIQDAL
jgi:hypothetical protein